MASRQPVHAEFGQFLAEVRSRKGWSQSDAGRFGTQKRKGINRNVIVHLETGKAKDPKPSQLRALADLYEVPYEEIATAFFRDKYGIDLPSQTAEPIPSIRPSSVEGFSAVTLLHRPIAAGQPLSVERDPALDSALAFRDDLISRMNGEALCLRVGRREESMSPMILPGDVVLLDRRESRRRDPISGNVYAVNFAPLTGQEGGALKRIERDSRYLIVSSENPDKTNDAYKTKAFDIEDKDLRHIIQGEVVWFGRYIGTGRKK